MDVDVDHLTTLHFVEGETICNEPMEVEDSDSNSSRDERFRQRNFFNIIENDDIEKIVSILEEPKYLHIINAQDANNHDNTPLHMAINRRGKRNVNKSTNKAIIDLLLSTNPDVTIQNRERMTALDLVLDLIEKLPSDPHLQLIKHSIEKLSLCTPAEVGMKRRGSAADAPVQKKQRNSITGPKLGRRTYRASGVKRALDGIIYQAKLLGLFAKRGRDKNYDFRLATEMDSAYKFDDVVFTYRNQGKTITRFLQAKHKQEPKTSMIKLADVQSTSHNNPFSLQKYLISFCNIMEGREFKDHEKKEFTIITNIDMDFSRSSIRTKLNQLSELEEIFEKTGSLKNDEILFIATGNAEKYKFSEKGKRKVEQMMKTSLSKMVSESKIFSKKQSFLDAIQSFTSDAGNLKRQVSIAEMALRNARTEFERGPKVRKTHFIDSIKKFAAHMKNISKNGKQMDLNHLNTTIQELHQLPVKKDKAKKLFIGKCGEVLKQCNNLHAEGSEIAENIVSFCMDESKVAELQGDIVHLKETKRKFTQIIDNTNTSSVDDIKIQMNECLADNEILDTSEMKKKLQPLLEMEKIIDTLEKVISEIAVTLFVLNKTGIDNHLKEFVETFRIVVCYPNEQDLSDLIEKELGNEFHLMNATLLRDSFEKEMLDFLKNYSKGYALDYTWKSCEYFFDELKSRISSVMTSGLSMTYPEELRSYEIVVKDHIDELNVFFDSSDQILLIDTKYTLLSSIKVLQTLESAEFKTKYDYLSKADGLIFLTLQTILLLKPQDFVVQSFSQDQSHNILVIDFQSTIYNADNIQKGQLFERLQTSLNNSDNKKIIIIAPRKEAPAVNHLYEIKDDGIQFRDLTPTSQRCILKRKIIFQGNPRQLCQIIDEPVACKTVHQATLTKLVEKEIQIGNEKAFKTPGYGKDYYIDRRLHRQKIKTELFEKNFLKYLKKSWMFLITGAKENDLQKLRNTTKFIFRWEEAKRWREQRKGIVWTSSVENNENKFNEICIWFSVHKADKSAKSPKSIHWLEYRDGALFWREFNGILNDCNFVAECIDQNNDLDEDDNITKKYILEENFFTNSASLQPKVILLANDSGMGKSVALTSIARKTIKFDDDVDGDDFINLWIIRIDLIEHAKEEKESSLGNIRKDWTKEEFIEFISKMAIPGNKCNVDIQMQRELFKEILVHPTRDRKQPDVLIHFDGFDEICSLSSTKMKFNYRENTIALLKVLKKDCSVTQFWITTRLHEKCDLERELETPALILSSLTRIEQEEFSNRFWKWNLQLFKGKNPGVDCRKLADRLTNIGSSLEHLNSNDSTLYSIQTLRDGIAVAQTYLSQFKKPNKRHLKEATEKIINLDFSQYITFLLDKLDKKFTNVPLHLQMLVEVIFEKEINFMESFVLLDLYRGFVDIKFTRHIERNEMKQSNAKQAKPFEKALKDLREHHLNLARDVYAPVFKRKITEGEPDTSDEYTKIPAAATKKYTQPDDLIQHDKYLTKPGLLKLNDEGSLEFVRPTFAEYFFTEYLIQNLRLQKVQKILLNEVLLLKIHEPVRQLLNGHLEILYNYKAKKEILQHEVNNKSALKKRLSEIKGSDLNSLLSVKFKDADNTTINVSKGEKKTNILHVMVEEHLVATIRFLFDKLKNEEVLTKMLRATDSKSHKTVLQLAIGSDSVPLIEVLLQNMKENFPNEVFVTFLLPHDSENDGHSQHSILQVARKLNSPETFKAVKKWLHNNLEQPIFDRLKAIDKDSQTNDLLPKDTPCEDEASPLQSNDSIYLNLTYQNHKQTPHRGSLTDMLQQSSTTSPIQTPETDLPSMIRTPMANLGNTCFMASVLQILFHLPAFTKDLTDSNTHIGECPCTLCILTRTFIATNPISTKRIPYKPYAMQDHLMQLSKYFKPNQQQDAHEFFNCLFTKLRTYYDILKIVDDNWRGQMNRWINCMSAECQINAEHETNLEYFYNGFMLDINHTETLSDALEEHFNEEQKQSSTCFNCKIFETNYVQHIRIVKAPKFLNITFKRFTKNNTKIAKPIQFDSKQLLDLSKWQQNQEQRLQYRLIGAITHTGDSIHNGHYFAVISGGNGKHYKFDDDQPVQECGLEEVTNAYMLFFQKVGNDISTTA